jgi:hypothetical protein
MVGLIVPKSSLILRISPQENTTQQPYLCMITDYFTLSMNSTLVDQTYALMVNKTYRHLQELS